MQSLSKEHKGHGERFKDKREETVKGWLKAMTSPAVIEMHKELREVAKWDAGKYEENGRLWLVTDLPQVVKYMQDVTYRSGN